MYLVGTLTQFVIFTKGKKKICFEVTKIHPFILICAWVPLKQKKECEYFITHLEMLNF